MQNISKRQPVDNMQDTDKLAGSDKVCITPLTTLADSFSLFVASTRFKAVQIRARASSSKYIASATPTDIKHSSTENTAYCSDITNSRLDTCINHSAKHRSHAASKPSIQSANTGHSASSAAWLHSSSAAGPRSAVSGTVDKLGPTNTSDSACVGSIPNLTARWRLAELKP